MSGSLFFSSHLFGGNATFVEELYARYLQDPQSVDPSWRKQFEELGDSLDAVLREAKGASWAPRSQKVVGAADEQAAKAADKKTAEKPVNQEEVLALKAASLVEAYRRFGHLSAQLDPLGITQSSGHPQLQASYHGFSAEDLQKSVSVSGVEGFSRAKISDLEQHLRNIYSRNLAIEFGHIEALSEREWLANIFEQKQLENFSVKEREDVAQQLLELEGFERFLHVKYPGVKRFSEEGGESSLVAMEEVIRQAARGGVSEIVIGMAHRGRMNVLTKIMQRSYAAVMSEFLGNPSTFTEDVDVSGDVKYHLGSSSDRVIEGKEIHLSLTANPSHLETVNPVVAGKVRAKQDLLGDAERKKAVGILVHGDAAFSGQGVVPETIAMSRLQGYKTGGTIHIIINNQVGFTTNPFEGRSTRYASDIAKGFDIPVLHVNGDDPEAVLRAGRIAEIYRQQFQKDVVIDVLCYRKYGHNEADEPTFTQPLMYQNIQSRSSTFAIYAKKLADEKAISADEISARQSRFKEFLEKEVQAAESYRVNEIEWLKGRWEGLKNPQKAELPEVKTGVSLSVLSKIAEGLGAVPGDFAIHNKLVRVMEARRNVAKTGDGIDWGMGEALAFGSLLLDGFSVRLSGQDCMRGTFSHRHSGIVDQKTGARHYPLNHLAEKQALYEVVNSHLSEYAVMGFEYGYSLAEPKSLTMWEGQFGDFCNGAQIVIDQCIAAGEHKWLRFSGLVLLLPHGQEGQGPEHSSARLERFLQLCAEDNMQVANCTTPANYFHLLRRQMLQSFRRPLVVMTPKSLLRHKRAVSTLADMQEGSQFKAVIAEQDAAINAKKVKRVVLCSGKVYYDLLEEREKQGISDIALLRLEQFYPFPEKDLISALSVYKEAEIIWCQEEPQNMGGWFFVAPRIEEALAAAGRSIRIGYAGRKSSASPAPGYAKFFQEQQQAFVAEALGLVQEKTQKKQA